ncbi:MAG: ATP-binding protein [Planctomycetes bacterium]|nr:ATP-binding protein [Planctomycetota bacterium]
MLTSLRMRLLAGTVGGMLLLLAALSLIVYGTIRRALFAQFDAGLESTAQLIAAVIGQDVDEVELGLEVQQMPEFRDITHEAYFQLWGPDEVVWAKSPTLRTEDLWRIGDNAASPVFTDWHDRGGRPLRAIGLRFVARPADKDGKPPPKMSPTTMRLTVARDATELHSQLRFLQWLLLMASAGVTALSLFIAAVVVRHGLAPLTAIAAQIEAIRADDLTARIEARHTPSEIAPIKDRLNDLLQRLQASFQREQRFTADVAHELRTPLAGLRSTMEVTLLRSRESREYQTVLSDCLGIVQNMQTMVNNLLMLARLEAHQITLRRDRILLADLVDTCWRPFAEPARQRQITFESTLSDDLTCLCDLDNLSMVVSNLLANASEYTDNGGRIRVVAQATAGHAELTIANTGCSLTQEQIAQVFDCFWRGDSSRRDGGLHCGLGLALVQRLMTALGGSATAELQAGGIFAVRLDLGPCATERR